MTNDVSQVPHLNQLGQQGHLGSNELKQESENSLVQSSELTPSYETVYSEITSPSHVYEECSFDYSGAYCESVRPENDARGTYGSNEDSSSAIYEIIDELITLKICKIYTYLAVLQWNQSFLDTTTSPFKRKQNVKPMQYNDKFRWLYLEKYKSQADLDIPRRKSLLIENVRATFTNRRSLNMSMRRRDTPKKRRSLQKKSLSTAKKLSLPFSNYEASLTNFSSNTAQLRFKRTEEPLYSPMRSVSCKEARNKDDGVLYISMRSFKEAKESAYMNEEEEEYVSMTQKSWVKKKYSGDELNEDTYISMRKVVNEAPQGSSRFSRRRDDVVYINMDSIRKLTSAHDGKRKIVCYPIKKGTGLAGLGSGEKLPEITEYICMRDLGTKKSDHVYAPFVVPVHEDARKRSISAPVDPDTIFNLTKVKTVILHDSDSVENNH